MNVLGMTTPYLASSVVNHFKPENKSQWKLWKDPNSIKVKIFLINENIPVTLHSNILTYRDSNKSFILDGDLLRTMINYKLNVDHSNTQDRKTIYGFGNERNFDIKQKRGKSNRDKSLIKLLKSPAIMASGISTTFLPKNLNHLCDRLKLIKQDKQAGKNSDIINEESLL